MGTGQQPSTVPLLSLLAAGPSPRGGSREGQAGQRAGRRLLYSHSPWMWRRELRQAAASWRELVVGSQVRGPSNPAKAPKGR